jgi:hypothetical protein
VIPLITRAKGSISKSFRTYLSHKPGKHEINNYTKQSFHVLHAYSKNNTVKVQKILHGK